MIYSMKKLLFVLSLLLLMPSCEKIGEVEDMMTPLEGHYLVIDQMGSYMPNSDMAYDASIHRSGGKWYLDRYFKTPKGEPLVFQNELTWNKILNRYLIEEGNVSESGETHHFETDLPFTFDLEEGIITVAATRYRKID